MANGAPRAADLTERSENRPVSRLCYLCTSTPNSPRGEFECSVLNSPRDELECWLLNSPRGDLPPSPARGRAALSRRAAVGPRAAMGLGAEERRLDFVVGEQICARPRQRDFS